MTRMEKYADLRKQMKEDKKNAERVMNETLELAQQLDRKVINQAYMIEFYKGLVSRLMTE